MFTNLKRYREQELKNRPSAFIGAVDIPEDKEKTA